MTDKQLIKWLRTYWYDGYKGPSMASDELGKKAADRIEELEAKVEQLRDLADPLYKKLEAEVKRRDRNIDMMDQRLLEVETENERLREALSWVAEHAPGIEVGIAQYAGKALKGGQ
jgi:predicted ribosome quality control (RQC) complex YloA/Tae2 family protein